MNAYARSASMTAIANWLACQLTTDQLELLGVSLPIVTIPVKPGRNLAVVIEVAAMNNRQKKMGYDTAKEFNERLMNMIL